MNFAALVSKTADKPVTIAQNVREGQPQKMPSTPEEVEEESSKSESSPQSDLDPNANAFEPQTVDVTDGGLRHIILDAGAFISGNMSQFAGQGADVRFYTTTSVIGELRDSKARHALDTFPHRIETRAVSREAVDQVQQAAEITGDRHVLSGTDINIIALALMIEQEHHAQQHVHMPEKGHLRSSKINQTQLISSSSSSSSSGLDALSSPAWKLADTKPVNRFDADDYLFMSGKQYCKKHNISSSSSLRISSSSKSSHNTQSSSGASSVATSVASCARSAFEKPRSQVDDLMGGEWLSADNFDQKALGHGTKDDSDSTTSQSSVACVTTDYSMQNVILQMGLRLLTVNGKAITSLRQWVLKCYACFTIERDLSRKFCEQCGGATLTRCAVFVDSQGKAQYRMSMRKARNLRGTKYSVPAYRQGRKANNIVLREDEWQYGINKMRATKSKRTEKNQDLYGDAIEFGRSKQKHAHNVAAFGYGSKNPNRSQKRTGKKKKKRS